MVEESHMFDFDQIQCTLYKLSGYTQHAQAHNDENCEFSLNFGWENSAAVHTNKIQVFFSWILAPLYNGS